MFNIGLNWWKVLRINNRNVNRNGVNHHFEIQNSSLHKWIFNVLLIKTFLRALVCILICCLPSWTILHLNERKTDLNLLVLQVSVNKWCHHPWGLTIWIMALAVRCHLIICLAPWGITLPIIVNINKVRNIFSSYNSLVHL